MITISSVEHWDNFGDTVVFWCECDIDGIPQKYIKKAKKIDGEYYNEDCFGACVIFDSEGFHMCQDSPKCELYYVDSNGDKIWMQKVFTYKEAKEFYKACFENITASLPQ